PLAIPTWKMFPALLCGNAVIFKPAEDVPLTAHLLVEVLLEAGLPPDVVQLVHGEGSVVGRAMVEHPDISVISFTGSTETGSIIGATCGRMHKRLSLEMGGKNAMIVMDDADLDLALEGVLWGAFGTTGQRCTATSRLVVGRAMVEHPDISVISFTGSTETGSIIGATCGRMHKRLSLEMGGKNAMIVMDDADLDLALEGVLWGAFGTTGQRCTATSRLI